MPEHISAISQAQLNVWTTCQRKFQHYFCDRFNTPTSPDQQSSLELGERFHLLMQQRELGLDVNDLADTDKNLQRWLLAFETTPPIMITGDRLSEHRRTLVLQVNGIDYLLTSIYDLLILGSVDRTPSAHILDWKTHQRSIAPAKLQADWQTRLYLYTLAQTTDYAPEQISMTYWFANAAASDPQNHPQQQAVTIPYTSQQHAQTAQDLLAILTEMSQAQANGYFPQVPLGDRKCSKCDFAQRCDRISGSQDRASDLYSQISTYAEVAI